MARSVLVLALLAWLPACVAVNDGKDFAKVSPEAAAAISAKIDARAAEEERTASSTKTADAKTEEAGKPAEEDKGGASTANNAGKTLPTSSEADLPPDDFDEAALAGEVESDPTKVAVPAPPSDGLAHDFVTVYSSRPERQQDMFENLPGVVWNEGPVFSSGGGSGGDARSLFGGPSQPFANYVPGMPLGTVQASNGLLLAHPGINVSCVRNDLLQLVREAEGHFGHKAVITSGYRSPAHNRMVSGAIHSQHLYCKALDLYMPGVSRDTLARFFFAHPRRGGLGLYCRTKSIHIDTGRRREWKWSCQHR